MPTVSRSLADLTRVPTKPIPLSSVFAVRDLEPDEILGRFAEGEPAPIAAPAGVV